VQAEFDLLDSEYDVAADAGAFINATSIGLGDGAARVPVAVASLRPELIVADVVFNPPQTWLIRTATHHGCRTLDGLGMLVNQAVICFKIWTGREPDATVMRDALEEFLEL
jgi:shikimate dehydrogenase